MKTRLKTIRSAVSEAMKTPIELVQLLNIFDIVDFSFISLVPPPIRAKNHACRTDNQESSALHVVNKEGLHWQAFFLLFYNVSGLEAVRCPGYHFRPMDRLSGFKIIGIIRAGTNTIIFECYIQEIKTELPTHVYYRGQIIIKYQKLILSL